MWRSYTGVARARLLETRTRNAASIVAQLGDELRPGERVNSRSGTFDVSNFKGTPAQLREAALAGNVITRRQRVTTALVHTARPPANKNAQSPLRRPPRAENPATPQTVARAAGAESVDGNGADFNVDDFFNSDGEVDREEYDDGEIPI